MASNRLRSRYQGRPPARRCSHGGANNRMGGLGHCRWGAGSPQPSAAPPARDRCITPQPPPPPSGGPLLPWLLTDGHVCRRYLVIRDLSEQPGLCQSGSPLGGGDEKLSYSRVSARGSGDCWSRRGDSNPRPTVYETVALPLSYAGPSEGTRCRAYRNRARSAERPVSPRPDSGPNSGMDCKTERGNDEAKVCARTRGLRRWILHAWADVRLKNA